MSDRPAIFTTTARLEVRATTAELLGLGQGRAPDPAIFDERTPFFWLNEISSNRLDAYATRMDPATTLNNFAAEAAEGRAFLAGHRHWEMPFGYTLTGTLETVGEVTRVLADAYTLRGLELGGVKTDSFIDGARAGLVRDTSVGFHGGWFRCDICGGNMRDWRNCPHIPGLTYEEIGEGNVVRQVLATATVIDAHLAEVSAVYDGATPGAAILKAEEGARMGLVDERHAQLVEQRYRIHLPDRRLLVPGAAVPPAPAPEPAPQDAAGDRAAPTDQETPVPQETPTPDAEGERATPAQAAQVVDLAPELRAVLGLAADADPIAHLRALAQELPQLRAQAADGKAYREQLEAEALTEAVRALGAEAEAAHQPLLASLPTATVRQMRDAWRAIGDARFPGGRQTVDQAPAAPETPAAPAEPESLYRG